MLFFFGETNSMYLFLVFGDLTLEVMYLLEDSVIY